MNRRVAGNTDYISYVSGNVGGGG